MNKNNIMLPWRIDVRPSKHRKRRSRKSRLLYWEVDVRPTTIRSNKSWWNEELSQLRRVFIKHRRLFTRAQMKKEQSVWQPLYKKYSELRQQYNQAIREAKSSIEELQQSPQSGSLREVSQSNYPKQTTINDEAVVNGKRSHHTHLPETKVIQGTPEPRKILYNVHYFMTGHSQK